jgi:sulfoxide reductase heme-binding subunit YedZ
VKFRQHLDVWLKPIVFTVCLIPFAVLTVALLTNQLGPNPIEELTDETGEWALRFILIGLAMTPLRHRLKKTWPVRLRRMIGLYAFFYASVHFIIYFGLDHQLDFSALLEDLLERPYVLAGFTALMIFLPLAITSTKRMARRLGRRWQSLHRWVYLGATAAVVHYIWLARGERIEPIIYLIVLLILLLLRLQKLLGSSSNKTS